MRFLTLVIKENIISIAIRSLCILNHILEKNIVVYRTVVYHYTPIVEHLVYLQFFLKKIIF